MRIGLGLQFFHHLGHQIDDCDQHGGYLIVDEVLNDVKACPDKILSVSSVPELSQHHLNTSLPICMVLRKEMPEDFLIQNGEILGTLIKKLFVQTL